MSKREKIIEILRSFTVGHGKYYVDCEEVADQILALDDKQPSKEQGYTLDEFFEAYKIACDVDGISAPPFSRIVRELKKL